jgi:hypothetical protein
MLWICSTYCTMLDAVSMKKHVTTLSHCPSWFLYTYECVHLCIYVCMCAYICIHVFIYMYTYLEEVPCYHAEVHVWRQVSRQFVWDKDLRACVRLEYVMRVYVCMCVYVCMYVCVCRVQFVWNKGLQERLLFEAYRTCRYACMYDVYIYIHTYIYIYIYIYTHTHAHAHKYTHMQVCKNMFDTYPLKLLAVSIPHIRRCRHPWIYIYMCVCVYIYIYTCVCVCVQVYITCLIHTL